MFALALTAARERIAVLTVDHGLREGSAADADHVENLCRNMDVPCRTLRVSWPNGALTANRQAEARAARYRALAKAAVLEGADFLLTAHHADDQAETLLMRLSRGSGLAGLTGIRRERLLEEGVTLLRPCLHLRSLDLHDAAVAAGFSIRDDPSNADPAYDRTRFRALLAENGDLDPARMAASVAHLAEAEAALSWTTDLAFDSRVTWVDKSVLVDPYGLPPDLKRRLVLRVFAAMDAPDPRGADLMRFISRLESDVKATLSGLSATPGNRWILTRAKPRR